MTTNFLIAYADIPTRAIQLSTYTETTFRPVRNLWMQNRALEWKAASSALSHAIDFDLGVGNSASANYIAFARMDRLTGQAAKVRYYLQGRALASDSWTTVNSWTDTNGMDTLPRYGTRLRDDYMVTFAASSPYRYWRFYLDSANATVFTPFLSKLFFGSVLDLGVEPANWTFAPVYPKEAKFVTTSGAVRLSRIAEPLYTFEGKWNGISDANMALFDNSISEQADRQSFFLYTVSYHEPLMNYRQLHVRLTDEDSEREKVNWNILKAKFEEVKG